MSRLQENTSPSASLQAPKQGLVYLTAPVGTDQDAIDWKMKKIHPKLFGLFSPVKYELVDQTKVFVPYKLFIFDYRLKRGKNASKLDREGQIGVIFDMHQVYPFHFDLMDDLGLQTKPRESLKGEVLKGACSDKTAQEKALETVKNKYLRRVLQSVPEVTLNRAIPFYREAWRLDLTCRGVDYEKFAYRDTFEMQNENVSGLKVRLDL